MNDPNEHQVGGQHYKGAKFQPWDWQLYGVGGWEQAIIKYVVRYRSKNGQQDLLKAVHYIDKLIYHVNRGEIGNTSSFPIYKLEEFVKDNKCCVAQEQAVACALMWRTVRDLERCKEWVHDLLLKVDQHG